MTLDKAGGAGVYSLPRTEDGVVKVAYRGTKYTNYATVRGKRISVPKTANVTEERETNIPLQALEAIKCTCPFPTWYLVKPNRSVLYVSQQRDSANAFRKAYISTNLPELTPLGISSTKLCWYTDSIDNSFLVDYLPDHHRRPGVFVCSGGSGHGFKFLPILGREVVKILERREDFVYRDMWRWRSPPDPSTPRNGLEEGEDGPRVLAKQRMATMGDWTF
jgi:sarcosine oxidase/L-pipecolate oxidase